METLESKVRNLLSPVTNYFAMAKMLSKEKLDEKIIVLIEAEEVRAIKSLDKIIEAVSEETYTKAELINLCKRAFNRNSPYSPIPYQYTDGSADKWIEENIK